MQLSNRHVNIDVGSGGILRPTFLLEATATTPEEAVHFRTPFSLLATFKSARSCATIPPKPPVQGELFCSVAHFLTP